MTAKALFRCSILVVCILMLSACTAKPNQIGDSSTAQATNSTAQATQNSDSTTQATHSADSATQAVPNVRYLIWRSRFIPVALKDVSPELEIFRLTYDSYHKLVDPAIVKHTFCDEQDDCYSPGADECKILSKLKSLDYPEEFFSDNTLFCIIFSNRDGRPFAVSEAAYEGNVLTFELELGEPQSTDKMKDIWAHDISLFVSVDIVLPEETEFQVVKDYVRAEE